MQMLRFLPRCLAFAIYQHSLLVRGQFEAPITFAASSANRVVSKTALCDQDSLIFNIRFEREFRGIIYSDGTFGQPNCRYVDGSIFPNQFYNVTIPLNQCNAEILADGTRRNTVLIQRDPRILEVWDNKYVLTCNPASSDVDSPFQGQFTVTLGGITVDGTLASSEVVTNSNPSLAGALDYSVNILSGRGPNFGPPVSQSLSIGAPISYVITLDDLKGQDARVGRCWATDEISNIQLSDDEGCSLQPADSNVWSDFQISASENSKVLFNNIKTWAFPTSSRVNIFCNLHMCLSGNCPPASCSNPAFPPLSDDIPRFKSKRSHLDNNNIYPHSGVENISNSHSSSNNLQGEEEQSINEAIIKEEKDEEMVLKVAGGFEVISFGKQDVLTARRFDPGLHGTNPTPSLVTGEPTNGGKLGAAETELGASKAEVGSSTQEEFNFQPDQVCIAHAHLIIALTLIFIIMSLSFGFTAFMIYRIYCGNGGRLQKGSGLGSGTGLTDTLNSDSHRNGGLSPTSLGTNPSHLYNYPDTLSYLASHPSALQYPSSVIGANTQSLPRVTLERSKSTKSKANLNSPRIGGRESPATSPEEKN